MKCPQCSTPLVRSVREGVPIDGCLSCGGTFLERPLLRPAAEEGPAASGSAPRGESPPERAIGCPRCGIWMDRVRYRRTGIWIDRCPRCDGIWLDARDLEAVEIGPVATRGLASDLRRAGAAPADRVDGPAARERTPLSGSLTTPSLAARIMAGIAGTIAALIPGSLIFDRPPYVPPGLGIAVASAAAGVLLSLLIPSRRVDLREDGSVEIVRRWGILRRRRRIANEEIDCLGTSFRQATRYPWIIARSMFLGLGFGSSNLGIFRRREIADRTAAGYSILADAGASALDLVLRSGERVRIIRLRDDRRFSGIVDYFRAALGVEVRRI